MLASYTLICELVLMATIALFHTVTELKIFPTWSLHLHAIACAWIKQCNFDIIIPISFVEGIMLIVFVFAPELNCYIPISCCPLVAILQLLMSGASSCGYYD